MTTIQERVEAGAAWLDANRPGWVDRINLETLDLGDPCRCVLGQEFPTFGDGAEAVRGYNDDTDPTDDEVVWCGFEHAVSPSSWSSRGMYVVARYTEYYALTAAWRDYITARRAAAKPHGAPHCTCEIPCGTCGATDLTAGYTAGCEECAERRHCAYDRAEFGEVPPRDGAA